MSWDILPIYTQHTHCFLMMLLQWLWCAHESKMPFFLSFLKQMNVKLYDTNDASFSRWDVVYVYLWYIWHSYVTTISQQQQQQLFQVEFCDNFRGWWLLKIIQKKCAVYVKPWFACVVSHTHIQFTSVTRDVIKS